MNMFDDNFPVLIPAKLPIPTDSDSASLGYTISQTHRQNWILRFNRFLEVCGGVKTMAYCVIAILTNDFYYKQYMYHEMHAMHEIHLFFFVSI